MNQLILVDKYDNIIGYKNKNECHKENGILHRAFSIYIIDDNDKILIQKRSKNKLLWPLYWSNSCCSHPRKNEMYEEAARRRIEEELGFTTYLNFLLKFEYQANYLNIGSENEICAIFIGQYKGKIKPNLEEIAEYKWIDIEELKMDIFKNPNKYTPWFKIGLNKLKF